MGSDGLFDNIYIKDMLKTVNRVMSNDKSIKKLAEELKNEAH